MLADLRQAGYGQAMVFTQYTDTMRFLREKLRGDGEQGLMCFSGIGGEVPTSDGDWRTINRDDAKRRFRLGEADILLCTDAAAEGLNFQFCGAIINYDMPWNPVRVEQRIGRIDWLGQKYARIRVINLHYEGTVETDVYRALRDRISLFETAVGRLLQPILAWLPGAIAETVLAGGQEREARRARAVEGVQEQAREAETGRGFDIDEVLGEDLTMPERAQAPVTLEDLDPVTRSGELMPPGTAVRSLGHREYGFLAPGMAKEVRVTTSALYYEEHADNVELRSPGNGLFTDVDSATQWDHPLRESALTEILDR